jgi:hypothetical protein
MPVDVRRNAALNKLKSIQQRMERLKQGSIQSTKAAAGTATAVSNRQFKNRLSGRPRPADRIGRRSLKLGDNPNLQWVPKVYSDGNEKRYRVMLSPQVFERFNDPSIGLYPWIQEIGTGKSATVRYAPVADRAGTITTTISIPSQRGRKIPRGLAWANAVGGKPSSARRGGSRSENLFRVRELDQTSIQARKATIAGKRGTTGYYLPRPGTIRREIHGKKALSAGAKSGLKVFRQDLGRALQAALK